MREKQKRREKNEARKGSIFGSISWWLLWQRKNRKRIYIYVQVERGQAGCSLPRPDFATRPWADVQTCDALSNQVPVEVIRDLFTGTRRRDLWPRDHVVCYREEEGYRRPGEKLPIRLDTVLSLHNNMKKAGQTYCFISLEVLSLQATAFGGDFTKSIRVN